MVQFGYTTLADRTVMRFRRPVGLAFRTDAPVLRVAFVVQQMIGTAEIQIVQRSPDARIAHCFGVRPNDERSDEFVKNSDQTFEDAFSESNRLEFYLDAFESLWSDLRSSSSTNL